MILVPKHNLKCARTPAQFCCIEMNRGKEIKKPQTKKIQDYSCFVLVIKTFDQGGIKTKQNNQRGQSPLTKTVLIY